MNLNTKQHSQIYEYAWSYRNAELPTFNEAKFTISQLATSLCEFHKAIWHVCILINFYVLKSAQILIH